MFILEFFLNYEYLWKDIEALIIDLRSKGKSVPNEIVEDLKSAKTLMTIKDIDPLSQINAEVEDLLRRTEIALISDAESQLGKNYADKWLIRIQEAKSKEPEEIHKRKIGFVTGIPKGEDWVRVRVSELIDMLDLVQVSSSLGLAYRKENKETIIIHGSPEKIKVFMRQLTEKIKGK
jgi:hypothetical protein